MKSKKVAALRDFQYTCDKIHVSRTLCKQWCTICIFLKFYNCIKELCAYT